MSDTHVVKTETALLAYLFASYPEMSRGNVKKRLKNRGVTVNGKTQTAFDLVLKPGDTVAFGKPARVDRKLLQKLYEDDAYIAIDKPAGVLSVAAKGAGEDTVLSRVRAQFLAGGRCWPVHRLDRETSGVLLIAKTREDNVALQSQWSEVEKEYYAVTLGIPKAPTGTIETKLYEDTRLYVRIGPGPDSRDAVTHYTVEKTHKNRALVRVKIDTGRKHQIRVHMAHIGCPLIGDDRYGKKGPRLGLHAHRLDFPHPVTEARVSVVSAVPRSITALLGG